MQKNKYTTNKSDKYTKDVAIWKYFILPEDNTQKLNGALKAFNILFHIINMQKILLYGGTSSNHISNKRSILNIMGIPTRKSSK